MAEIVKTASSRADILESDAVPLTAVKQRLRNALAKKNRAAMKAAAAPMFPTSPL